MIQLSFSTGKLEDAVPLYEDSMAFVASVQGTRSGDYVETLVRYGNLLDRLGKGDEAADAYSSASTLLAMMSPQQIDAPRRKSLQAQVRAATKPAVSTQPATSITTPVAKKEEHSLLTSSTKSADAYITQIYTARMSMSVPQDVYKPRFDSSELFRLMEAGGAVIVLSDGLVFFTTLEKGQYHWKTSCHVNVREHPIKGHPYYLLSQSESLDAGGERYALVAELIGKRK